MKNIFFTILFLLGMIYFIPEVQIQLCQEIIHDIEIEKEGIISNLYNNNDFSTREDFYQKDSQIIKQIQKQIF
jgi:hypothetical protein